MRTLRNLAFLVLLLMLLAAPTTVGAWPSCPDGCSCDGDYWGGDFWVIVDCSGIYDCGETYPEWCDETLPNFCWGTSGCQEVWGRWTDYVGSCSTSQGCYGECNCGGLIGGK
jgi:hypothetical protein